MTDEMLDPEVITFPSKLALGSVKRKRVINFAKRFYYMEEDRQYGHLIIKITR